MRVSYLNSTIVYTVKGLGIPTGRRGGFDLSLCEHSSDVRNWHIIECALVSSGDHLGSISIGCSTDVDPLLTLLESRVIAVFDSTIALIDTRIGSVLWITRCNTMAMAVISFEAETIIVVCEADVACIDTTIGTLLWQVQFADLVQSYKRDRDAIVVALADGTSRRVQMKDGTEA